MLLSAFVARADEVTFEALSPKVVTRGEVFRVEFTLNAEPSGFVPPSFQGFDVLAGPTEAKSQSIQIINGDVTKSLTFTYTFVLQGNEAGKGSVSAAEVTVEGQKYRTEPFTVEIVDEGSAQSSRPAVVGGGSSSASSEATISKDDIFVRVTVDKSRVYKGEPVRATFKLYTRQPMSGVESAKYPSFNGFWTQELSDQNYQWQRENYNNKVYDSRIIREYLLYPQQVGTLQIEPFDLTVIAQIIIKSSRQSVFDDFFGAGPEVQEVRRKLSTSPVRIEVMSLPSGAPASFNGAVGQFSLDATAPQGAITANSAATYTLRISGRGNLPLINAPKVEFPTSFELYNVKTTESLKTTTSGISGYRQFEYPFIARAEGRYVVPAIEFSYFDPRTAKYEILSAPALELEIARDSTSAGQTSSGIVSGLTKEEIKILGQDIRFIRLSSPQLAPKGRLFMWSPLWFCLMGLFVVLFIVAYTVGNRYLKNMRNDRFVRGRRANKMALRRFRAAEDYMKQGDQHGFYEEMLRALWGYMSDKLDIPVADLSRENIREELYTRNIPDEQADRFIRIIAECEQAQYSPVASAQMHDIYREGVDLLSKFESAIKR